MDKNKLAMNGIVYDNGVYEVYVRIQDGTEFCGEYKTEQEARDAWVDSQKTLNNAKRSSDEVSIYEFQPVTERKLVRIG